MPRNSDPPRPHPSRSFPWLGVALIAEVLVVDLLQLPSRLGFNGVAFGDYGFNLTAQSLISRGYRPAIDFGYPYGSLSLLFGKLWFGSFGATPASFFAATVACDLAFVVGVARFFRRFRLPPSGLALVLAAIPSSVTLTVTFAHGLERALIGWALAEQARGSRRNALAVATGAVYAKPTMGFVYGVLLLALIVTTLRKRRELTIASLVREMSYAAMTGAFLFTILSFTYGPAAVLRMLLPLTGAAAYRLNQFGFFGKTGSAFWYFPGVHVGYYVGTPVTFWFVATAFLLAGGWGAASRLGQVSYRAECIRETDEVVLSCALMQLAFVTLFFGSNASWANYVYIPIMGVGLMTRAGGRAVVFGWLLAAFGVMGQKQLLVSNLRAWHSTAPTVTTANLWASADERREWSEVLDQTRGGAAVVLSGDGAAQTLFAQFSAPTVASLLRGQTTDAELQRELKLLSQADLAIVPEVPNSSHFLDSWPEFDAALHGWSVKYRGKFFTVYQRPS